MFKTALLALAAASAVALPALAQEDRQFEATTLRLSAQGEAHAAPDIATINLGVQTDAPSAAEAMRQNRTQMSATIAALKVQGVLSKDIQTSGLNLNPQYTFKDNERHLNGYQASNSVTITVRDLSRLGATVDAVVAAGANQINGVTFSLSDPQHADDEARRAAVKALEAKAALYAEAAGYHVARLVSLSDTAAAPNVIRPMMLSQVRAQAVPLATVTEPGELDVTATVSAVYELKK
jgi:uncharacterized protein YggE